MSPPLILGMLEGRREEEEEEKEQWKDIDKKEGFYGEYEKTTLKSWNAREATRAMKDQEID